MRIIAPIGRFERTLLERNQSSLYQSFLVSSKGNLFSSGIRMLGYRGLIGSLEIIYKSKKNNNVIRGATAFIISPFVKDSFTYAVTAKHNLNSYNDGNEKYEICKLFFNVTDYIPLESEEMYESEVVAFGEDESSFAIIRFPTPENNLFLRSSFFIPTSLPNTITPNRNKVNHILFGYSGIVNLHNENQSWVEGQPTLSFGNVKGLDKDHQLFMHDTAVLPGSSGSVSVVLEKPSLLEDISNVKCLDIPLFSGVHQGGSPNPDVPFNISYLVDNEEFKQAYAKHVVDTIPSKKKNELVPFQNNAINKFLQ